MKYFVFLLTFLFTCLTMESQLHDDSNFGNRDLLQRLLNFTYNVNQQNKRLKSDGYQKLDSTIRPEYSKDNYYYDDRGRIIQYFYYRLETEKWTNADKQNYHYDGSGNLKSIDYYVWDDLGKQWILKYQYEIASINNLLYSLTMKERTDTLWTNTYKMESSYDTINNLINETSYDWDINAEVWKNSYKREYIYNQSHIIRISSDWTDNQWTDLKKIVFNYDSLGNMIVYNDSIWDNSEAKWVHSSMGEYTYDTLQRPILTIISGRDETNQLINVRKIDYNYTFSASPDRLMLPYFRDYYYDEFVDITTASFTMQKWNTSTNEWYFTYNKDRYFSDIAISETVLIVTSDSLSSESTDTIEITLPTDNRISIDITSNTSWEVLSDQDWLNVSHHLGSNNSSITLTAEPNPTTTGRTAIVTVTVTGGNNTSKSNNSTISLFASATNTDTITKTIKVFQEAAITFIIDLIPEAITIYPIPVSDILFFNTIIDRVEISIFDINGKMVINEQITNHQINLSNLPNGIYTIKIKSNSGIKTKKILKQ